MYFAKLIGHYVGLLIHHILATPARLANLLGFNDLPLWTRLAAYGVLAVVIGAWFGVYQIGFAVALNVAIYFEVARIGKRREQTNSNHVRGNRLADLKEVQAMAKGKESRISLGEAPLPKDLEQRHILIAGTTGTGKTQLLHQIVGPARREARAIVVDIGGAMVSKYYNPATDEILNPRDARSVDWSPLAEIETETDAPLIAKAIIPDGEGSAAEWNAYAQRLLTAVLVNVYRAGGTTGDVVRLLTRASTEELREACEGQAAEGMLRDGNEKMLGSILAIIASYIEPLAHLDPNGNGQSFSVSKWVRDGSSKSFLFLNFTERQIETLKPLITAVVGISISALLDLPEDPDRRMFYILDEFDALGPISGISSLLTRGRRFGAVVVIAVQTVSQIYKHYGEHEGNTLLANLGTQCILRLPDATTAEWASRVFGDETLIDEQTSTSTQDFGTDRSTNVAQIQRTQRVVMPSEIQNMPDLTALVNIAGDIPPCVTKIPVSQLPKICEGVQKK